MTQKIRKAVFPVGGMGTRFLPATKAVPKELLPIVDRPLLQYAVDEALAAGCEQMIFVTARGKGALEDYFDIAGELVATLRERGKAAELAVLALDGPPMTCNEPPVIAARPAGTDSIWLCVQPASLNCGLSRMITSIRPPVSWSFFAS